MSLSASLVVAGNDLAFSAYSSNSSLKKNELKHAPSCLGFCLNGFSEKNVYSTGFHLNVMDE